MKIIVENKLDQPIMCDLQDMSAFCLFGKQKREVDSSNLTSTVYQWEKNGIVTISEAKEEVVKAEEVVEDKKKKKSAEKVEDKEIKEEK